MVNFLLSVSVATALGFLAGMGVGGGSLLLLWLTQAASLEQSQARIINLLFFLPAAMISTCFHRKRKTLEYRSVIPGILAGCGAAVVFSLLSAKLDIGILKKLLGGLLIFTGLREIFYRPRNAK